MSLPAPIAMKVTIPVALMACAAVLVSTAPNAGASNPAPAEPPAEIPPQLQALEQKMALLTVNSESFTSASEQTSISTTTAVKHGHRSVERTSKHRSTAASGAASISPSAGYESSGGVRDTIQVGSSTYLFIPSAKKHDGGRPWVRDDIAGLGAGPLFPDHSKPFEKRGSGTGPYAALENLISTASGPVTQLGTVTVDGQATSGFALTVSPDELLGKGNPLESLSKLLKIVETTTLEVFIDEAGVPLRTIERTTETFGESAGGSDFGSSDTDTTTTEITGLEVTVAVKAPPPDRTIGLAKLLKIALKQVQKDAKRVDADGAPSPKKSKQ